MSRLVTRRRALSLLPAAAALVIPASAAPAAEPLPAPWLQHPQKFREEGWYAFKWRAPDKFYVLFARRDRGRMMALSKGRDAEPDLWLSWTAFDFLCVAMVRAV